jgi:hypothetical protein
MKRSVLPLLLVVFAFAACETTHRVAVSTFRVVDAPAAYVRRKLDVDEEPPPTTTATTQTNVYTDNNYPPAEPPPPSPPPPAPVQTQNRIATEERNRPPEPKARPSATPRVTRTESASTAPRTAATSSSSQKSEFPYGKPVPGKPGYVFSPYDKNGGYVDVTGYSPGQKVKDPYTGEIFLVP